MSRCLDEHVAVKCESTKLQSVDHLKRWNIASLGKACSDQISFRHACRNQISFRWACVAIQGRFENYVANDFELKQFSCSNHENSHMICLNFNESEPVRRHAVKTNHLFCMCVSKLLSYLCVLNSTYNLVISSPSLVITSVSSPKLSTPTYL